MLKSSPLFKKNKNFTGELRILRIKNAKCSGYYFYMNLNLEGDFSNLH